MERPWLKFFTRDWAADPSLRACSYAARGLWIDCICLMHQNHHRRGFLEIAGRPLVDPAEIARLTGGTGAEAETLIAELERNGVFARDERECIFSRRLVRDEENRIVKAKAGSLGGAKRATALRSARPWSARPTTPPPTMPKHETQELDPTTAFKP